MIGAPGAADSGSRKALGTKIRDEDETDSAWTKLDGGWGWCFGEAM